MNDKSLLCLIGQTLSLNLLLLFKRYQTCLLYFYSELVNIIRMSRLMLLGILLLNSLVVFGDKYCLQNEKPVRLESRL